MLGLAVVSSTYAESYTMYAKPDVKSDNLGKINRQNPQYQKIFSKDNWIEVVNKENGQIGWVKQEKKAKKQSKVTTKDPIREMMDAFQKRQKIMNEHFNKLVADIDQNVSQMQLSSGATTTSKDQPKVYKNFSSITINSDGKTAKIVKKTEDGDGNTQTIEKEVPSEDLKNLNLAERTV